MSILEAVRKKYKTSIDGTDKTDKRASVGSVSPTPEHFQSFSTEKLRLIAGDDWAEIEADPVQLAAFKASAEIAAQIQRGEVPAHYTATTVCTHCGPVPIFEGLPSKVKGCPWCLARVRGVNVPNPRSFGRTSPRTCDE